MIAQQTHQTAAVINHAVVDSPGYERYPLTMTHPHYKPPIHTAVPGTQIYNQRGEVVSQDYQGTAAYCPPVTAASENEEARLAADGYVPAGQVDPSAWVKAHSDAPGDAYVPQKYPMWREGVLYKTAQDDPEATTEDDLAPPSPREATAAVTPTPATPDTNLSAQMDAMQATMRQMSETMQALAAENASLKAQPAADPKPRGRPKKAIAET